MIVISPTSEITHAIMLFSLYDRDEREAIAPLRQFSNKFSLLVQKEFQGLAKLMVLAKVAIHKHYQRLEDQSGL